MKKHQYVKMDCNCRHKDTYFTCKHCGAIEHSRGEILQNLALHDAVCMGANAPNVSFVEIAKANGRKGSGFDCLAPDHASWNEDKKMRQSRTA